MTASAPLISIALKKSQAASRKAEEGRQLVVRTRVEVERIELDAGKMDSLPITQVMAPM